MPYPANAGFPLSVRDHLPEHAQDIHRAAFNHAFAAHAGDPRQEEACAPDRLGLREAVLCQGRRSPGGASV